jgi:transcription elongation factor Elf1
MSMSQWDGDDDDEGSTRRKGKKGGDFDCPSCSAHNPVGDPLKEGDEVLCNYCGTEFEVRLSSEGKVKLRER